MKKAFEYNNKIVKQQEKIVKDIVHSYYNNECTYKKLECENKKLFANYKHLEKIINNELKINK